MAQRLSGRKTAFVHDFLVSYGGAERVLESLVRLDPDAPIYTLLYDAEAMSGRFEGREIRTSFLQKLPRFLRKRYRLLLPLFPVAAESLDLREFDLVISSSGAWAKGIVTRLRTFHIAYLHSPMRLLWDANGRYLDESRVFGPCRALLRFYLSYLRVWDREAADRPDLLVSNSRYTRSRVEKYYRRDSAVITPPVALPIPEAADPREGADVSDREEFFLVVSRLTASKGIDVAVEAFNKLELPLRIVGSGRERARLETMAGRTVDFLGTVDDKTLASLYRRARAVVVPSEEDFGLAAAEAVSCGTPVITVREGGASEVVEEGKTGESFGASTPESLADAVRRFLDRGPDSYVSDPRTRERFSEEAFLSSWRDVLREAESERTSNLP
ncbi:MAG: glycosyltransferase family 4 protein [Candidatus Moranbacteria bacterium]|nr:glycosyltransferase family 4 protein [Candidatus Moranbacteria bacterium]NTW46376.1 glycosyltransferase family 4 protein [Candidatus Moranbacteria bacterium]